LSRGKVTLFKEGFQVLPTGGTGSHNSAACFVTFRFGTDENIPAAANLPEMYRLSNELCLYIRLTSPPERGEYVGKRPERADNFLDKTKDKIESDHSMLG
jgi:hypothetical protein